MSTTNDFLPFATGASPNVISQAAWAALAARASGFEIGTALSDQLNKVWRQSQFQAVVLATLVEQVLNINVNDDGNVSAAVTNLIDAIEAITGGIAQPFTNLASASTADLGTVASRNVNITGTVAITSFGASASVNQPLYFVTFAGALVLTQGSALLLPGGVSIATAAGDSLLAEYLGGGNWRVLNYMPATPPGTAFANLASGTTTDLGTIPSQNVNVTGTTTITAFGSSASLRTPIYLLTFAAVLTLTNGAALALPGGANIKTAAGDACVAQYLGSGNWRVIAYFPAAGPALGGTYRAWIRFSSTATVEAIYDPLGLFLGAAPVIAVGGGLYNIDMSPNTALVSSVPAIVVSTSSIDTSPANAVIWWASYVAPTASVNGLIGVQCKDPAGSASNMGPNFVGILYP